MKVVTVFGARDIREITASVGVVRRPRVWRFGGVVKLLSSSLDCVVTSEGFAVVYPSDVTSGNRVVTNAKIVDNTAMVEFKSGVFQHRDGFLSGVIQHRDGFLSGVFQHRDFEGVASV